MTFIGQSLQIENISKICVKSIILAIPHQPFYLDSLLEYAKIIQVLSHLFVNHVLVNAMPAEAEYKHKQ